MFVISLLLAENIPGHAPKRALEPQQESQGSIGTQQPSFVGPPANHALRALFTRPAPPLRGPLPPLRNPGPPLQHQQQTQPGSAQQPHVTLQGHLNPQVASSSQWSHPNLPRGSFSQHDPAAQLSRDQQVAVAGQSSVQEPEFSLTQMRTQGVCLSQAFCPACSCYLLDLADSEADRQAHIRECSSIRPAQDAGEEDSWLKEDSGEDEPG